MPRCRPLMKFQYVSVNMMTGLNALCRRAGTRLMTAKETGENLTEQVTPCPRVGKQWKMWPFSASQVAPEIQVWRYATGPIKSFFFLFYAFMPDSYTHKTDKQIYLFSWDQFILDENGVLKCRQKSWFWRWIHYAFMFPCRTLHFAHACMTCISSCKNIKVIRTLYQPL